MHRLVDGKYLADDAYNNCVSRNFVNELYKIYIQLMENVHFITQ